MQMTRITNTLINPVPSETQQELYISGKAINNALFYSPGTSIPSLKSPGLYFGCYHIESAQLNEDKETVELRIGNTRERRRSKITVLLSRELMEDYTEVLSGGKKFSDLKATTKAHLFTLGQSGDLLKEKKKRSGCFFSFHTGSSKPTGFAGQALARTPNIETLSLMLGIPVVADSVKVIDENMTTSLKQFVYGQRSVIDLAGDSDDESSYNPS